MAEQLPRMVTVDTWAFGPVLANYPDLREAFLSSLLIPSEDMVIRFGKYKGQSYPDVVPKDPQYWKWVIKQDFWLNRDDDGSKTQFIKSFLN